VTTRTIDGAKFGDIGTRLQCVLAELQDAVKRTDRGILAAWGVDVIRATGLAGLRRVERVGTLIKRVGKGSFDEARAAIEAGHNHQLPEHAIERGKAAWQATKELSNRTAKTVRVFSALLKNRETLPLAVTTIVAALVASGGVDGDGGIPDLDLQLGGIGAHRSILTHSIIAGTVCEGGLYGLATLVGLVYERLPSPHDDLWDVIERNRVTYLRATADGISAGIAYHLLVDGLVQPGTYHGLGIELPQPVHDAIATLNGIAEGADVTRKTSTFRAFRSS
jgi:hypothetical protein